MKLVARALGALLATTLVATPALADALIDNVDGLALDKHGKVIHFTGLLLTPAGKITKLLKDGDKRPEKLDWRTDMHGKVLMPGFVDAETHVMDLGFRTLELDLSGTQSLADAQAKIAAYVAAHPDRKWILGAGWDPAAWGKAPTAADLDAVAGDRPVVLERSDGRALWVNSQALAAAGISAATKPPAGGAIDHGLLTGSARALVERVVPQPLARERDLAFIKAQQVLLASGVTAADDMGTTLDDWLVFRRGADAGNLRMRIVSYADSIETANRAAGNGPSPWLYDDMLRMVGVTVHEDGPLGTRDACLKAPYADDAKSSGTCLLTDDQLRNTMSRAAMDGFQVTVRAVGDKANAQALGAIDALSDTYKGDRRWRVESAAITDPADLPQFGKHGLVASMQPSAAVADTAMVEARLGAARLGGAFAWRGMLDAGAPLAFGSGAPGGDPNPFHGLAAATTRQNAQDLPFGGWQPQQRVTIEQAWDAYTRGSAYASFAEDRFGMLAPGEWADFIIVDHDPTMASPSQIRNVHVEQTWVGGRMMWSRDGGSGGR
ncbi:MAG: amidohydrolase family protein [Sphingomonas sp.]